MATQLPRLRCLGVGDRYTYAYSHTYAHPYIHAQAEVLSIDSLRAERVLTGAHDHTCRMWKIPEESQLIFRCARRHGAVQWVAGGGRVAWRRWGARRGEPSLLAASRVTCTRGDAWAATLGRRGLELTVRRLRLRRGGAIALDNSNNRNALTMGRHLDTTAGRTTGCWTACAS